MTPVRTDIAEPLASKPNSRFDLESRVRFITVSKGGARPLPVNVAMWPNWVRD